MRIIKRSACGITLDIGRQRINQKELLSLIDFVKEKKMIESFNEMRKGKIVNASEHRSALHTSLRDPSPDAPQPQKFTRHWNAFCKFAEDVRNWKGAAVPATESPMSLISVSAVPIWGRNAYTTHFVLINRKSNYTFSLLLTA